MIVILDFGSQYTQLIARKVRESHVYCEIHPFSTKWDVLEPLKPSGIILSGGPSSVYEKGAPKPDKRIFDSGLPLFGICYGLQCIVEHFGGKVQPAKKREYGPADVTVTGKHHLFEDLPKTLPVWMSHGDAATKMPKGFVSIAETENAPHVAIANEDLKIYGVQFHPEVHHTPDGVAILKNFTHKVCGDPANWSMKSFLDEATREVRATVKKDRVILGLSGGVDSSVVAALLHRAIGKQLTAIFVDNGVLRSGEKERMRRIFDGSLGDKLKVIDASKAFLSKLKGVTDPEKKRKIIGKTFIEVFDREATRIKEVKFLAQGTLYPDVIESVSVKGPSAVIKSHHNVGGLPKKMKLKLVEPVRFLFKDEVRSLGRELNLPSELLNRHPFPGPGLAIRILGEVTAERVKLLQKADLIVENEIRAAGLYDTLWQAFAVLLPVKSVGVMGDQRTYENTVAVRAVTSQDAMTADWADLPRPVLARISNRIINEVKGINRVVLDISSKPPATIEWGIVSTSTDTIDLPLFRRGKVRDVYDLGDHLLFVTSDRISAFDFVLPSVIPDKGKVLNEISAFWFKKLDRVIANHMISTNIEDYPDAAKRHRAQIERRSMLVQKTAKLDVECIVRGYLAGSGWKEYQKTGSICGVPLPKGLQESEKLPEPIFTPTSKAEVGAHDENMTFEEMIALIGKPLAETLRKKSLELYDAGSQWAESKGIILADTKFEFGVVGGQPMLIDEVLTPDSSRFWENATYAKGRSQDSFDKQFVRDYLESIKWDKKPPVPSLPLDIVKKTREKYIDAFERITGTTF